MSIFKDDDFPSELLEHAFYGKGSGCTQLAAWLARIGERIRNDLEKGKVQDAELGQFEENVLQMQRELRALAEERSVPLPGLPMTELPRTPLRVVQLVAGTVEALVYLSRRPEFSDDEKTPEPKA